MKLNRIKEMSFISVWEWKGSKYFCMVVVVYAMKDRKGTSLN